MANPESVTKEHHPIWQLVKVGAIIGLLAVGADLAGHYFHHHLINKQ